MQGSRHRLTPCAAALAVALVRSAEATDGLTCPPEPTVMNLAYGDTVTCTRDTDGDSDVFRFAGTAGEVAMIYVAGSSSRPCLELIAPNDARQVACSFGAFTERLDVSLDQTGTWAIQVTGVFNAEYVLTLERVVPPSPNRTGARYGDLVPGVFDVGGDMDLIAFAGSAGDSVTLLSSGGCVELIEPDNTRPHACATRIDAVLGTSGAQSVLVGPGSGSYSVSVQCLVGPCVVRDLTCTGAAECDDGNDCTADACSPADPAADATGCLHPQATCDDGDPCTTDACEPIGGCTHTPVAGCGGPRGTPGDCSGAADFTPCGGVVAACQPACRAGACATPTVCEQTNATPAPAGKRALDVACRGSGAGGEFCAAQAFVPSAGAADSRAVTKRLQKAIASDGSVTFRLRLNKYGKKLLKRARRERRSLLVIVRIALGTRDATAFLLREVELGA